MTQLINCLFVWLLVNSCERICMLPSVVRETFKTVNGRRLRRTDGRPGHGSTTSLQIQNLIMLTLDFMSLIDWLQDTED